MTDRSAFEEMLSGGHHNSLGRTEEVVAIVLADRDQFDELFQCYFSADEIVRLRTSSAMKRVTTAQPLWTMDYMDRLQTEIAAIDQASTQWTLANLFDLTRGHLSEGQSSRALEIMKNNIANHNDWIVLNTTMQTLVDWCKHDDGLEAWLRPQLKRLTQDGRKAVSGRAQKMLTKLDQE